MRGFFAVLATTAAGLPLLWGCGTGDGLPTTEKAGAVMVSVEPGEHYRHRLKVAPLIHVRNPPQMAVWVEDSDGTFLETLYVSHRTAHQDWRRAPGDDAVPGEIRRPEALPVWSHRSGADSAAPPDGMSGATPKGSYRVAGGERAAVVVFLEVNHSTDFNAAYPPDARRGAANYSGGPWGSGQPSLVYRARLDPSESGSSVELELAGRGSPDGGDGELHGDLSGITTARSILQAVRAEFAAGSVDSQA